MTFSSHYLNPKTIQVTQAPIINYKRSSTIWSIYATVIMTTVISIIIYGTVLNKPHRERIITADNKPFNPQIVAKVKPILLATNNKNLQLVNFDPCIDIKLQMTEAGYSISALNPQYSPEKEDRFQNPVPVTNHPNILYKGTRTCFWIFGQLDGYVTLQHSEYSAPLRESEIAYRKNIVWDPDSPPQPGMQIIYATVRFEIKGYTAHIISGYDATNGKKTCFIDIRPYVYIGATGQNCDQVRKLTYLILP